MDWDKLKAFYTVSQVGSISKASEVLHISQSALSRQIQSLESRLKTLLFKRHRKGVLLTEAGKILFKTAERVVKEISTAESLIVRHNHKEASSSLKSRFPLD